MDVHQWIADQMRATPEDFTGLDDHQAAEVLRARASRTEWQSVPTKAALARLTAAGIASLTDASVVSTAPGHEEAAAVLYWLDSLGGVDLDPGSASRLWLEALTVPPANLLDVEIVQALIAAAQVQVPLTFDGGLRIDHGAVYYVRKDILPNG